jgi:CubicO group peptidase (beta-lactamase class C family)
MLLPALLLGFFTIKAGIEPGALKDLVERAKATHSDALVVMHEGKVVVDEHFGSADKPIETMSATKSVVSVAVGLLIDEGKIPSVDTPVQHFYPDYKGGDKEKVTIRHLLEHTSGITANPTTQEIYASGDFVKNALDSDIKTPPGTAFFYNNKALNLLAGIVSKAAGKRMDLYLDEKLFKPLGIKEFGWSLDRAGNPHGMSGLRLRAADFAKIGQLMLDGGVFKRKQMISKRWVESSTQPSKAAMALGEPCGQLWWPILERQGLRLDADLLDTWRKAGVKKEHLKRLEPMVGKLYQNGAMYVAAIAEAIPNEGERVAFYKLLQDSKLRRGRVVLEGKVTAYMANGYLGQYLVVVPDKKIVAVRLRRQGPGSGQGANDFIDFASIVCDLPIRN